MKKILSVLLVVMMVLGLTACGSKAGTGTGNDPDPVNTAEKEKTEKTEYYKGWANSADFGTEGEFVRMDLSLDGSKFVMDVGKSHMTVVVGGIEMALYELEDKTYFHMVNPEAQADEWMVSPAGEESLVASAGSESSIDMKGEDFKSVEYVETVTENGVKYDVVNVTTNAIFEEGEEPTEETYKMYVNADTHKLAKVLVDEEVEPEDGSAGDTAKIKVTGTVSFYNGETAFEAPAEATETTYDELMMAFAFSFMGLIMSGPAASIFGN
ncbi:MAG: hypothetical protein IIU06_01875 [Erysipelotrichales bacterium]|nr:hypothetical protein [Erysipelotrichales bacterium]